MTAWHKEIENLLSDCTGLQKLVYSPNPMIHSKMPVACLQQLVKALSLVKYRLEELQLKFRVSFMPLEDLVDLQLRRFRHVTELTISVTMFTQGRQFCMRPEQKTIDNEVVNMHPDWIIDRRL